MHMCIGSEVAMSYTFLRSPLWQANFIRRMFTDEVDNYVPCLLAEFSPPAPDLFYVTFYHEMATKENLLSLIHALPPDGVHELMCQPGYADSNLIGSTLYARQRDKELAILTSGEITQAIIDRNIQLVTFAAV